MRKVMLSLGAAALLAAGGFGCAHGYHESAAYHREQARTDARHGDFGHALHNERKAIHDDHEARKYDY